MGERWSADVRPGDEVPAISLWEPRASLMALGAKLIETRSWLTRYRGPLLICAAGRRVLREIEPLLADDDYQKALAPLAPGRRVACDDLSFGRALVLVDLYDCQPVETLLKLGAVENDLPFGDFSPGRYGWVTAKSGRRRLKPFPVVGRQRLFKVEMPSFTEEECDHG